MAYLGSSKAFSTMESLGAEEKGPEGEPGKVGWARWTSLSVVLKNLEQQEAATDHSVGSELWMLPLEPVRRMDWSWERLEIKECSTQRSSIRGQTGPEPSSHSPYHYSTSKIEKVVTTLEGVLFFITLSIFNIRYNLCMVILTPFRCTFCKL